MSNATKTVLMLTVSVCLYAVKYAKVIKHTYNNVSADYGAESIIVADHKAPTV